MQNPFVTLGFSNIESIRYIQIFVAVVILNVNFVSQATADTIHACVNNGTGRVTIVESAKYCNSNQYHVSWNSAGQGTQIPTYTIGDTGPAGGIVFYVTNDGLHGFEAAPADVGDGTPWGCGGEIIGTTTGLLIGSGMHNTEHIVGQCSTEIAADQAATYSFNGYTDWFLPSRDALLGMYKNLHAAGIGDFTNDYYWASSKYDFSPGDVNFYVWMVSFSNGGAWTTDRYNSHRVRPIRKF